VSAAEETDVYVFGGFSLERRRRLLFAPDGHAVHLNPRAFDTLLYLVEHPNQLVDKRTLMKAVWPNSVVEENNLNQHIAAVRRALGEAPAEHRFVVTVQGRGFRFVPSVTAAVAPETPTVHSRRSGMPWAVGVTGLVIFVINSWYAAHQPARGARPAVIASSTPSAEVAPMREPRLVVLPFENLSADPANAFYTDRLNEEIVSTIAEREPGIEVISRATLMRHRADASKPLAVVARELGASDLMEGSVKREATNIHLTLQLIDARTGLQVWSKSYDSTVADAPALESQVADEVARQLSAIPHATGLLLPCLPCGRAKA